MKIDVFFSVSVLVMVALGDGIGRGYNFGRCQGCGGEGIMSCEEVGGVALTDECKKTEKNTMQVMAGGQKRMRECKVYGSRTGFLFLTLLRMVD